jgi:hypothetical protein
LPDRAVAFHLHHLIFGFAQGAGMPDGFQASLFGQLWQGSFNIEGDSATHLAITERGIVPVENGLGRECGWSQRRTACRPDGDWQEQGQQDYK